VNRDKTKLATNSKPDLHLKIWCSSCLRFKHLNHTLLVDGSEINVFRLTVKLRQPRSTCQSRGLTNCSALRGQSTIRRRRLNCVCVSQLLDRNPATRLGMPNSPHGAIRDHQFFRSIDWQKLERRELESPFKPKLVGRSQFIFVDYYCYYYFAIGSIRPEGYKNKKLKTKYSRWLEVRIFIKTK